MYHKTIENLILIHFESLKIHLGLKKPTNLISTFRLDLNENFNNYASNCSSFKKSRIHVSMTWLFL